MRTLVCQHKSLVTQLHVHIVNLMNSHVTVNKLQWSRFCHPLLSLNLSFFLSFFLLFLCSFLCQHFILTSLSYSLVVLSSLSY